MEDSRDDRDNRDDYSPASSNTAPTETVEQTAAKHASTTTLCRRTRAAPSQPPATVLGFHGERKLGIFRCPDNHHIRRRTQQACLAKLETTKRPPAEAVRTLPGSQQPTKRVPPRREPEKLLLLPPSFSNITGCHMHWSSFRPGQDVYPNGDEGSARNRRTKNGAACRDDISGARSISGHGATPKTWQPWLRYAI